MNCAKKGQSKLAGNTNAAEEMKEKTESEKQKVHCADRIREQALLTAGEGPANAAEKPSATHWMDFACLVHWSKRMDLAWSKLSS